MPKNENPKGKDPFLIFFAFVVTDIKLRSAKRNENAVGRDEEERKATVTLYKKGK